MTHIQGSFVLSRGKEDHENLDYSKLRARAQSVTGASRLNNVESHKCLKSSVSDGAHSLALFSSDEEDDDTIQPEKTVSETISSRKSSSPDISGLGDNLQQLQTTPTNPFAGELYDSDLDSDDDNLIQNDHTPEQLYLSNCKKYGVIPSSLLIRIIHTSDSCVEIHYSAMKPLNVKAMIPSLKIIPTLTKIDLSSNGFGSLGAVYLTQLIEGNKHIMELNLSYNDIGLTGCEALCKALTFCRSITTLVLNGNRFDDKCAVFLAELLSLHKYLLHVSLSQNTFGNTATAHSFAKALSNNQSLEHLDISFNHFQQNAIAKFIKFLSTNFRLRSLNLRYSSFGLAASKELYLAMKTKASQLQILDLSSNLVDDHCAKYIGRLLSTNESLQKLYLMENILSADGCYTMLEPLKTMPTTQLQLIDIRDMSLKSEDLSGLITYLENQFIDLCIQRGEKITATDSLNNE